MIAATRVSSRPVRWASSAAVIFCCSQSSATLAIMLKVLLEPEAMIADVARVHVMSPTDFIDRDTEGRGDLLPFARARRPAADGDRFDPFGRQPGALGDVFDRKL